MDQEWLLYVVVCGGKGLHIGPSKAEGDLFCMIHTQVQDEPRSRTVVFSISWAFIVLLPFKHTDLDICQKMGSDILLSCII
jgi:hypothetical protein